ncbi:hypothetical protein [Laspinema olomoucense]|uniref:Sigma-70 family RNA polymerase sigma factor n=1 Tax=Laspinema olomoucense D3b TaxID=2953688 RepID=A0ABT2NEJ5_9CYAN|nr:hypothetical protein [Laspinema sp. D3b]MCT7979671.1 hypothetical protein [Laspinema sp. D3b]
MDDWLRKQIEEVCLHPTGSLLRQQGMNRLLIKLQQLPGLYKSYHLDDLEALNETWERVSKNICENFQQMGDSLEESLTKWINADLYKRRKRFLSPIVDPNCISLDQPRNFSEAGEQRTRLDMLASEGFEAPFLDEIESQIQQAQERKFKRIALRLKDYIDQDPLGRLQGCHPDTYPKCTCQALSQRRGLKEPPDEFHEIASDWNMPISTLTNHWYGRCRTLLKKIAKELGYEKDKLS